MPNFLKRVIDIPVLGIGLSTEYGAAQAVNSLDIMAWREAHPEFAAFLEVGVEVSKGLDALASAWSGNALPTTYHFLDVNLDEKEDLDASWLRSVKDIAAQLKPVWMCGDAGLWHFGKRERGHMLLLPPILSRESARYYAEGVMRLRDETGYEVIPENPPGKVFVGDLHILDFFAAFSEEADTGMLLDCAHLAITQSVLGLDPLAALDGFPLERVIEIHVAGSTRKAHEGWSFWEDDHTTEVMDDTWRIFEWVVQRAPNLKAVVFECERNHSDKIFDGFSRIQATLAAAGGFDRWRGSPLP